LRTGLPLILLLLLASCHNETKLPSNAETTLLREGFDAYSHGNWDAALESYSGALHINPNSPPANFYSGVIYHLKKDYTSAIEHFNNGLSSDSANFQLLFNRGLTYMEIGHIPEARADFLQCAAINPASWETFYYLGLCGIKSGDDIAAVKYLMESERLNPGYFWSYFICGIADYRQGDYGGALSQWNAALKVRKDFPEVYCYLGYAQIHLNDYKNALINLKIAMTMEYADPSVYVGISAAYLRMKDISKAKEYLLKAQNAGLNISAETFTDFPYSGTIKQAVKEIVK